MGLPRRQRAGDFGDHVVHNRLPSVAARQLLRNSFDMTQCDMHIGDEGQHLVLCRVHGREMQSRLAPTLDRTPHAREQQRAACDGLHARAGFGRTAIQRHQL